MSVSSALRTTGGLLATVIVPAAAFLVAFPLRTDYAGHFLAGAGGTAVVVGALVAVTGRRPWLVVAATTLAVAGGVVTEATVFRLAIFDPVDLANQSLGAVIVGATVVGADRSWRLAAALVVTGAGLLAAGFVYAFA